MRKHFLVQGDYIISTGTIERELKPRLNDHQQSVISSDFVCLTNQKKLHSPA